MAFLQAHPGEIAFIPIDIGVTDVLGACLGASPTTAGSCAFSPHFERALSPVADTDRTRRFAHGVWVTVGPHGRRAAWNVQMAGGAQSHSGYSTTTRDGRYTRVGSADVTALEAPYGYATGTTSRNSTGKRHHRTDKEAHDEQVRNVRDGSADGGR